MRDTDDVPEQESEDSVPLRQHTEVVRLLEKTNERLSCVLAGAGLGAWDWWLETNEVTFDDQWMQMLGLDPAKTPQDISTWSSRVHPDDLDLCYARLKEHWTGQVPVYEAVHRLRHANGSWVWILGRGRVSERDSAGKPIRITGTNFDITAFKESELLSSEIQKMANIGGWELDVSTQKTRWTDQTYRIHGIPLGTPTDTIMGIDFYARHERPRIAACVRSAMAGKAFKSVFEFINAQGQRRWMEVMGEPLYGADGKIHKIRGTFQDVTDKVEAETRLKQRDAVIHAIVSQSPDGIVTTSATDGTITSANPAALRIFGFEREEDVLGLTPLDLSPLTQDDGAETAPKAKEMIERAVRNGSCVFEWTHVRPDGTRIPCTVRLSKVALGDDVFLQGTIRDNTELLSKEAELQRVNRALLEEKRQLESLIQNAPGITYQFRMTQSGHMYFNFASAQALEILGVSPEEFRSNPRLFYDIALPEDLPSLTEAIRESGMKLSRFQWEGRVGRIKEIRWIRAKSIPRPDGEGGVIWDGMITDITDEKRAAEELAFERSKALHAAKLASLGEMSAGVAHEINNPLAIIQGTLALMSRSRTDEAAFRSKVDTLEKAVGRIARIVQGLRKFARAPGATQMSRHSLTEIAREALVMVGPKAIRESTQVSLEADGPAPILCDPIEIEQVLINLVNNGIDAAKTRPERWVNVRISEKHGDVILQVIDSGHGLSAEIESKLFQPFFTTKAVGEGTGLGLSICKGILDHHGASLSLNRGVANTCFEARFPSVVEVVRAV